MSKTNIHHIIPRSIGGTNHPDNMRRMNAEQHDSFHHIFFNLPFAQQVIRLIGLNGKALNSKPVIELVSHVTELEARDLYNQRCYNKSDLEDWKYRNRYMINNLLP